MELKDFIRVSLEQIAGGVHGAQTLVQGLGGYVNPIYSRTDEVLKRVQNVEFDVAIVVSESSNTEGGAKVTVFGSSIGGKVEDGNKAETSSRLKFTVPVQLPLSRPEQGSSRAR